MTDVLIWRRLLTTGSIVAVLILALGGAAELALIGPTDAVARARAERAIQAYVDSVDGSLTRVARVIAGRADVLAGITGDRPAVRSLFELLRVEAEAQAAPDLSITIYDARGTPRAWSGRPTELGQDGIPAGIARIADAGQAGLRMIHAEPVVDPSDAVSGGTARRLGSVVTERVLARAPPELEPDRGFVLETVVGHATLRAVETGVRTQGNPDRMAVTGSDGRPLIDATISLDEIARTRARWRTRVVALFLIVLAVTTFSAGGVVLLQRGRASHIRTIFLLALCASVGRAWLWLASTPGLIEQSLLSPDVFRSIRWGWLIRTPLDLLLTVVLFAVLVVLLADAITRRRQTTRTGSRNDQSGPVWVIWQAAAVALVAVLLAGQHLVLRDTVAGAAVDLLHTALLPFDSARVSLLLALVIMSAATVWAIGLVCGVVFARRPVGLRRTRLWLVIMLGIGPTTLVVWAGWAPLWSAVLTTTLGLALASRWLQAVTSFRHADPLARVVAALCAILLPVLPLYVALVELTDGAKRQVMETSYAVRAAQHPENLLNQLTRSREQIDAIPNLLAMTASEGGTAGALDTDRAFGIWRRTALARSRLTSAVELYGADGALNSRFALNIPEDAVTAADWAGTGCEWEVFGEPVLFGAQERRMLHAERGICMTGPDGTRTPAGAVVVHMAQVDYESLPFLSSQSPYVELSAGPDSSPAPGAPRHDVELVIYGWGLQPTFVSGRTAWVIGDALFQRIYASRVPFWTRFTEEESTPYDVLITNDRAGIYALGYAVYTWFDHLLHVSELAILVIAAFALVLVIIMVVSFVFPRLRGQLVLREVRPRFALKLQLWFLGVATAPVLVVAVLIQGYFADQLRADVEAGAIRTAAVAQSVIEETLVPRFGGQEIITPLTDDALVRISHVVGRAVNIFDGPQLVATSERDLYASGLLSTRTPDMVYRAIALDRLPNFVGEDAIGSAGYQLAAVPVSAVGRDVILTVPLASRQREIESQIVELTRRVWGSALFFAAVVGFIGWAIARNIANPVKRLTHATSRVARGEFHAPVSAQRAEGLQKRVADGVADELEILESDFNKMAVELDAQRRQLERTHRLEAWTEMARQVAHEIKNPLTPVQLSAEHLLRVHADRGSPLSPVLQACVDSILKQVRILRQIASEFSSYASSPVADLAPTALAVLIEEIIGPYRPGLDGRIRVSVDVPTDLPMLQLDGRLMRRALTNIFENALHAMPGDGALSISVVRYPAQVHLVVVDTGVGLERDALARIFEPYFSTKVTGTGLGMAIVKRNVELNGGSIAVSSERGQGTTVTITLPQAEPPIETERIQA
jgi:signal transduction histidine kinase